MRKTINNSGYFIYALIDPRDEHIKYIGKSFVGLKRPKSHVASSKKLNNEGNFKFKTKIYKWIRYLSSLNLSYSIYILEEIKYDKLNDLMNNAERNWIKFARSLGIELKNHTDGGEGLCVPWNEHPFFLHPPPNRKGKKLNRIESPAIIEMIKLYSVEVVCLNNGQVFESISSAARQYKLNPSSISACCKNKLKKTGGFRFAYFNGENLNCPLVKSKQSKI